MKIRTIMLCACIAAATTSTNAKDITDTLTASTLGVSDYGTAATYTSATTGVSYTAAASANSTKYPGSILLKDKAKSGIAVTANTNNLTLKSVKLTFTVDASGSNSLNLYATTNTPYTSYNNSSATGTLISSMLQSSETASFSDGEQYFYIQPNATSAIYLTDVQVTWIAPDDEDVAIDTPQISLTGSAGDTFDAYAFVAIAVPTVDDATIYYTLDGSNPQTSDSRIAYTGAFIITSTTTVKAIAEKTGMTSSAVAEHTFTKTGEDVYFISDFIGQTEQTGSVMLVGTVTVQAQSQNYLFVEDSHGDVLAIWSENGWGSHSYNAGDRISKFAISHPTDGNDNADINLAIAGEQATFTAAISHIDAVYQSVDATSCLDTDCGRPIIVTDATLSPNDETGGWTIADEVVVDFSQFGEIDGWPAEVGDNDRYTITCVLMPDGNGSRTLWPIAIASEVSNSTAAPHISGDTFFHTSTTITITAVSGADIYYTTDGTTPAAEETEATHRYSSAFEITGTTIVKAIAVVSGQEPSAVATMRFIEAVTTGIEAIAAPDADDSTQDEYFTLQGIRITDPANGLYIKRCGAHYTKVLIH